MSTYCPVCRVYGREARMLRRGPMPGGQVLGRMSAGWLECTECEFVATPLEHEAMTRQAERVRLLEQEVDVSTSAEAEVWAAARLVVDGRKDLDHLRRQLAQPRVHAAVRQGERIDALEAEVAALKGERDRLRGVAESFADEVESAERHFESRGAGGQQVSFHGDFAGVDRLPSVRSRLKWWAKRVRAALEGK